MSSGQIQTPEQVSAVAQEALDLISQADSPDALEQLRINYLGKKGVISLILPDKMSHPKRQKIF